MKKLLLFLLFLPMVSAELEVSPSSFSVDSFVGVEEFYEVVLTNKFNFSLFNFEFSDNDFMLFPDIDELLPNESVKLNISFLSDDVFSSDFGIVVKFFYLADVNMPSITKNVSILPSRFEPNHISIVQGDFVRWFNNDSIPHSVTSDNFDHVLQPNESRTIRFNSIGSFIYEDVNVGLFGIVDVEEGSLQFTNNPSYDKLLSVSLNSFFESSELELELLKDNFSVVYNSEDEGVLKVRNVGGHKLFGVDLESDMWISFEEDNFDLGVGSENFVVFNIVPEVFNVSMTNVSYSLRVSASANNSGVKEDFVSVFIPFESFVEGFGNKSVEELRDELRKLQEILSNINFGVDEPTVIFRDPEFLVNFTEEQVLEDRRRLTTIEEIMKLSFKSQNDDIDAIKGLITEIRDDYRVSNNLSNSSYFLAESNKELLDKDKKARTFQRVILVILVLSFSSAFAVVKYRKKMLELEN